MATGKALWNGIAFFVVMSAGIPASADTIAWWHFDECEPGTTAPANTVASDQAPTTYAHVYTVGNNNTISSTTENGGNYLPTYTKPFRGLAVYDPVTDTIRTNNAAMKFRIARGGSAPDTNAGRARFGGALKFEGGYDLYSSLYGTSAITVEAFLCTTGGAYNLFAPIVGSLNGASWTDERFALYMRDDGTIAVRFAAGASTASVWYTGDGLGKTKVNDGAWHHVAFTYDGSDVRIYVDYALDKKSSDGSGRVYAKTGSIPTYSSDNTTWVGGYATGDANNGGRKFPGVIDEIRVSNATLQPEQFLRMQQLDADDDEVARASFDPGEYGFKQNDWLDLADDLGPNRNRVVFRRVSGADPSTCDTVTKAGDVIVAGLYSDIRTENVASYCQTTNAEGTANYIQVPYVSGMLNDNGDAAASYTIETFFKTRGIVSGGSTHRQVVFKFGSQPWINVIFNANSNRNLLYAYYINGTKDNYTDSGVKNIDDGNWHHVACVVDGTAQTNNICFYIDYQLDKAFTGALPDIGAGNSLFVGAKERGEGQWFDGWIDDVRVSKRALTPREFLTTRPVGSGDISLLALFEQDYDFACASNADLSVTGVGEARIGDNVPTFVKESRGALLLDGTNGTEQATNEYSVHLSRSRVVFPSSPFWALDSYTVEFWAKFDGVIDANGTVAADPETLASHIPIMRLAKGNGSSYDWYIYRGREKENNKRIQIAIGGLYPTWVLPSEKLLIDGRWHHYAFTFEPVNNGTSTLVKLFYDYKNVSYGNPSRSGVTVGSRLPMRVDGRLMLGEGSKDHPNLVGEFDAVRVSKGVLDPSQFLGRVRRGFVMIFR